MQVFMLEAKGGLRCFRGKHTERTSTAFLTWEAAESRIERFRDALTDIRRLNSFDPEGLEVKVVALDVVEE